jgi:hypothetical protein
MPDRLRNFSYRSLELLCRKQAALASSEETRRELEIMAGEYAVLADRADGQRTEPDRST